MWQGCDSLTLCNIHVQYTCANIQDFPSNFGQLHDTFLCRWKGVYEKTRPKLDRAELGRRLSLVCSSAPGRCGYCSSCGCLLLPEEWGEHQDHDVRRGVGAEEVREPTRLLSPMEERKAQAVCSNCTAHWILSSLTVPLPPPPSLLAILLLLFYCQPCLLRTTKTEVDPPSLCGNTNVGSSMHHLVQSDVKDAHTHTHITFWCSLHEAAMKTGHTESLLLDIDHRYVSSPGLVVSTSY